MSSPPAKQPVSNNPTAGTGNDESDDDDDGGLSSGLGGMSMSSEPIGPPLHLDSIDMKGLAGAISKGTIKKVVVLTGAGVSVSAGIPDFRSPGTGLYDNLQKYNLPNPMSIFELNYFKSNPKPFCMLAKELYPGGFDPTPAHFFIKLLSTKGLLVRNFTQNIDGLESRAGISADELVQAHGGFATAHCIACKKEHSESIVKAAVFADEIPKCSDSKCGGLVKPDIVFFGESLPRRFGDRVEEDFKDVDLLLVMGTSLQVQPFASLIDQVPDKCIRVLINNEKAGERKKARSISDLGADEQKLIGMLKASSNPQHQMMLMMVMQQLGLSGGGRPTGFDFDGADNKRDIFIGGTCDSGCATLAAALGWEKEFNALMHAYHSDPTKSTKDKKKAVTPAEAAERAKAIAVAAGAKPNDSDSKSTPAATAAATAASGTAAAGTSTVASGTAAATAASGSSPSKPAVAKPNL